MWFTLYPIAWVADQYLDAEPFDQALLPFEITPNICIEDVGDKFRPRTFALGSDRHGNDIREELEGVRCAIVHRYDERSGDEGELTRESERLVREVMACLRLVRPMRANALLMRGHIRSEDGSFDVMGYDVPPLHLLEVPEVQKLFKLRSRDCHDLRRYAGDFLSAMRTEVWKFRMAVQFHDLGHFQCLDWKARYLLWASAIESIFTTKHKNHYGSAVATERIKWFIGAGTSIYAPGDLTEFEVDPNICVGDIVNAWYNVRNHLAHGDRIPDIYFHQSARHGLAGPVSVLEVLAEAASFIVRTSLLKILREGLTRHFEDAKSCEAYFDSNNLTNSKIATRRRAAHSTSPP